LKTGGTVWAWGYNESGELGNGIYDGKTEITLGDNKNEPVEVSMLQNVVEIAAGGSHAMAVQAMTGYGCGAATTKGNLITRRMAPRSK